MKSQAQSKISSAEQEAEVKQILAKAQANVAIANSEAQALELQGCAIGKMASELKNNSAALQMFSQVQQAKMVQKAANLHLFFTPPSGGGAPAPLLTYPVQSA